MHRRSRVPSSKRPTNGRSRHAGERGETLVEMMVSIAIIGIAFVAILTGLGTAIRLSGQHRGTTNAQVVLASAAESVKSQTYVPCPGLNNSSYSPSNGVTFPAGWAAGNVAVIAVKGWNGSAFVTPCPGSDGGLELITIKATSPDGLSSETLDVVKRVPT